MPLAQFVCALRFDRTRASLCGRLRSQSGTAFVINFVMYSSQVHAVLLSRSLIRVYFPVKWSLWKFPNFPRASSCIFCRLYSPRTNCLTGAVFSLLCLLFHSFKVRCAPEQMQIQFIFSAWERIFSQTYLYVCLRIGYTCFACMLFLSPCPALSTFSVLLRSMPLLFSLMLQLFGQSRPSQSLWAICVLSPKVPQSTIVILCINSWNFLCL